jgi:putative hemolysin
MKVERKKEIDRISVSHNKPLFIVIIILFILLIGIVVLRIKIGNEIDTRNNISNNMQVANPASVFCIENNGTIEIKTDIKGGQYGVCVFWDKSECEEWAFFRGECNASAFFGSSGSILECNSDSDCVAASCCHSTSCVSKDKAPLCSGIACTMNCQPNTLDCGYGSCSCVNNKCTVVLS